MYDSMMYEQAKRLVKTYSCTISAEVMLLLKDAPTVQ